MNRHDYIRTQPFIQRDGRTSSLAMETEIFHALRFIAITRNTSMAELIRSIDAQPRPAQQCLPSAIRCHIITTLLEMLPSSTPDKPPYSESDDRPT
jgi:predicted DNA-binding ribbon-helix-helix protein